MLTKLTLLTTLALSAMAVAADPPSNSAAASTDKADNKATDSKECTTDDGVSTYISCQKDKFSTTQLVIGAIGVVLGLFLIGFGIFWLINRRKRKPKPEDGGEGGKKSGRGRREVDDKDGSSDEDDEDERDERRGAERKQYVVEDSEDDSEDEKRPARAPAGRMQREQRYEEDSESEEEDRQPARRPQQQSRPIPARAAQPEFRTPPRSSPQPSRPAPKQQSSSPSAAQNRQAPRATSPPKSTAARVETESEDSDSSEEEDTDSNDSDASEQPTKPAPKPEIKKPQATIQRIPRTASPEPLTDAGSPIDRQPSRQLYPSNPSPLSAVPVAVPQASRSRQSAIPARQSPSPSPPDRARSRESTMPLNVRKDSSKSVRQQSFYEPSSRPLGRGSPAEEQPPRRPSVPRMASDQGAGRSAERPRMDWRPSEAQEGSRKGSSSSGRRPSERGEGRV